jgi:hypothetical protein
VQKILISAIVSAAVLLGVAPAASAAAPVGLLLPQSTAFSILGHSCGGIQEQAFATGFDATSGYPTGDVYMQTSCGGSGRGGGYHSTTYSAWAGVTWDFTGAVVSSTVLSTAPTNIDPSLSAYDANGNEVYNASSSAYLVLAPTFTPAPRVTSVSPGSGSAAGGTSVAITGTGFTGATGVSFGGTAASNYVVTSDTSITAVAPAASAGTVDVAVTTAGGANTPSLADEFTFIAVPSVSSLSPNRGPIGGGTSVTITGTGFTGATAVTFGGTGTSFTVNSDSSITAVAPPNDAADTVTVSVVTPGGTSAANTTTQFTYVSAPTITGFTPHSGKVGTAVTITGTHLSGATKVTFGGMVAVISTDAGSKITTAVPAGATTGRIKVKTAGGTAISSVAFTVT